MRWGSSTAWLSAVRWLRRQLPSRAEVGAVPGVAREVCHRHRRIRPSTTATVSRPKRRSSQRCSTYPRRSELIPRADHSRPILNVATEPFWPRGAGSPDWRAACPQSLRQVPRPDSSPSRTRGACRTPERTTSPLFGDGVVAFNYPRGSCDRSRLPEIAVRRFADSRYQHTSSAGPRPPSQQVVTRCGARSGKVRAPIGAVNNRHRGRSFRPLPCYTTRHAGPHRAVREIEVR